MLLVLDLTSPVEAILGRIKEIRNKIKNQKLILVANKSDLVSEKIRTELSSIPLKANESLVFVAAKAKENLTGLIGVMHESVSLFKIQPEDVIVTNIRHYEALTKALDRKSVV